MYKNAMVKTANNTMEHNKLEKLGYTHIKPKNKGIKPVIKKSY